MPLLGRHHWGDKGGNLSLGRCRRRYGGGQIGGGPCRKRDTGQHCESLEAAVVKGVCFQLRSI